MSASTDSQISAETYATAGKACTKEQKAYFRQMPSTLFVIEIDGWDWPLHVGATGGADAGGDLSCVQTINIRGSVVSPEEHHSKSIEVWLTPLPRDLIRQAGGPDGPATVGVLEKSPPALGKLDFFARLFLPEDALDRTIFCLGTLWRSMTIWVEQEAEASSVSSFAFSKD